MIFDMSEKYFKILVNGNSLLKKFKKGVYTEGTI